MSPHTRRALWVAGSLAWVVTGCGGPGAKSKVIAQAALSGDAVQALWNDCRNAEQSNQLEQRAGGMYAVKHPGLELYVRTGAKDNDFATLFQRRTLIGAVKNVGANEGPVDEKWTMAPKGTTCVFMGGDPQGLYATLVSADGQGQASAETREVTVRFHKDAHPMDDAQWDRPLDHPPLKEMGVVGLARQLSELAVVLGLVESGSGPWYTCSAYTCCKSN